MERHVGNRAAYSRDTIAAQLIRGLQHFLRVGGVLRAALRQGHSVGRPLSRRFWAAGLDGQLATSKNCHWHTTSNCPRGLMDKASDF